MPDADRTATPLRAVKSALPARVTALGGVPLTHYDLGEDSDPSPVCGPGLAYRGLVTVLAGREGEGKSTLAAQLSAAVTAGSTSWLGDDVNSRERRPVAWITGDGHQALTAAAIKQCGGHLGLVATWAVEQVEAPGDLHEICQAMRPALVVVDPLLDLLRPQDERSYTEARALIRSWRPPVLWGKRGRVWDPPALLGITHEPKTRDRGRGDRIIDSIGSVGISTAADLLLAFRGDTKLDSTRRTLEVRKSRVDALPRGAATWLDFDLETRRYRQIAAPEAKRADLGAVADGGRKRVDPDAVAKRVREWCSTHPGGTWVECAAALGISTGGRGTTKQAARAAYLAVH